MGRSLREKRKYRQVYKRQWIAAKRARLKQVQLSQAFDSDTDSVQSTHAAPPASASSPTISAGHDDVDSTFPDIHASGDRQSNTHSVGTSASETNSIASSAPTNNFSEDEDRLDWDAIDHHEVESSEDSDSDDDHHRLECNLAAWTSRHQVKHNAVDALLKILRQSSRADLTDLPCSARTLLKTTKHVPITALSGMEYYYFGMQPALNKCLNMYSADVLESVDTLDLSFNIDGLPLFKSSGKSLWPVLCSVGNVQPVSVFPVVLTLGMSKPKDFDFLSELIDDLAELLNSGLLKDGKTFGVTVKAIVCDAPAKAFVKCIKQYSGYYGCDKCTQRGDWVKSSTGSGRVTYQNVDHIVLRTNETFREKSQEAHHTGLSPFCRLPIDMIGDFPIDYMHQVCLGTMRRVILAWKKGPRQIRLSANQILTISERLLSLKKDIPSCFVRKPRSLIEVDRWKATEYRQFLLYTGKIVLKGILSKDLYDHFMCLNVAIALLVCPNAVKKNRDYAHQLLVYFVCKGRQLYGKDFLVYNVHSLLHLSSESERYGSLDNCSAFCFENYMQTLKRLVRSGRNPLAQIVKRLSEMEAYSQPRKTPLSKVSNRHPNNAFVCSDSSCCEVVCEQEKSANGETLYLCRVYDDTEAVFDNPCDSRTIGVYEAHRMNAHMRVLSSKEFSQKAILVQGEGHSMTFLAVLHEHEA